MRVLVTSCETDEGAWRTHERKLKRLFELSDKRHELVDDPEAADLILVGNVREEDWAAKTSHSPIIGRFPGKSFSLSDRAGPIILHHGVYTACPGSALYRRRVRTGAYTLYPDEYLNPFIVRHTPSPPEPDNKRFLLSFIGRRCHPIRDKIFDLCFEHSDVWIEDSSEFDLWNASEVERLPRQRHYYDILLASKFCLCPRGASPNSIRLFEAMQLGVAPVIITSDWVFPKGPDWGSFAIVLRERDIPKLESIVQSHEAEYARMGLNAQKAYFAHFAESSYFDYVVESCLDIAQDQIVPEWMHWRLRHVHLSVLKARRTLRVGSRLRALLSRR